MVEDQLLLLEHPAVYTLGRGAETGDLLGADERLAVPVFRVGRGGGVTFHGPGQLVAYPIMQLQAGRRDVRAYIRTLEQVAIGVCADFGVRATHADDQPGAWVEGRKVASIGVGIRRWTSLHGLALNVSTDLRYFEAIVPCRMPTLRVSSLARERGVTPSMADVEESFERHFCSAFGFHQQPAIFEAAR